MKRVYLGLGTNLGNREHNLQEAVDRLHRGGVEVLRVSPVYETKPMYVEDQPLFLNMVIEGQTSILPRVLLKRLKSIEREIGRKPSKQNGPRTIDIDILFYSGFVITAPELTVPHPHLAERRFVLEPLVKLAPEFRHPVSRKTMRELLAATSAQDVQQVDVVIRIPSAPGRETDSNDSLKPTADVSSR